MRRAPLLVVLCAVGCSRSSESADAGVDNGSVELDADAEAGPLALATELTDEPMRVGSKSMVFDGEHYAVAWVAVPGTSSERQLMFARVSTTGEIVDGPAKVMPFDVSPTSLRLFAHGDGYRLWFRRRSTSSTIWGVRLDGKGAPMGLVEELDESRSTGCDSALAVDYSGDGFGLLVEKYDSDEELYRVHFRRFSSDLVPLAPSEVVAEASSHQSCPSLTWIAKPQSGEGVFLGLWRQSERIQRVVLDAAGAVVAEVTALFDNGESQQGPSAVPDRQGGALALWWGSYTTSPLMLRLDPVDASWSGPARLLPDNRSESLDLTLAAQDGQALIVWQSNTETALPVIRAGWFDLSDATELQNRTLISDASHSFWSPQAVTGEEEIALLFTGAVMGSERLYFRILKRQ
jgi:hypothetical protein